MAWAGISLLLHTPAIPPHVSLVGAQINWWYSPSMWLDVLYDHQRGNNKNKVLKVGAFTNLNTGHCNKLMTCNVILQHARYNLELLFDCI